MRYLWIRFSVHAFLKIDIMIILNLNCFPHQTEIFFSFKKKTLSWILGDAHYIQKCLVVQKLWYLIYIISMHTVIHPCFNFVYWIVWNRVLFSRFTSLLWRGRWWVYYHNLFLFCLFYFWWLLLFSSWLVLISDCRLVLFFVEFFSHLLNRSPHLSFSPSFLFCVLFVWTKMVHVFMKKI